MVVDRQKDRHRQKGRQTDKDRKNDRQTDSILQRSSAPKNTVVFMQGRRLLYIKHNMYAYEE